MDPATTYVVGGGDGGAGHTLLVEEHQGRKEPAGE